ncbi:metallophosphoesterase [Chlorobium limicola DSM 245]|uniref:Metallophosphoesterase n=2 Tax=Chlorobium limicola TaxID=1092 RepID=B3EFZ0_CHLL2|nr:choice-of-anchor I family protein [Chlorobium limicola]ACD89523.1 metallophosphoesterase [Chlorobium limicola DSM 245]
MALRAFNENNYLQALLSHLQSSGSGEMKISVISDPHYFAPSLGTTGEAFEAYLAADRKMIAESDAILQSALDIVESENPDILLVAGDLTKDGEKISHQAFADYLSELESTGVRVYVIPGNHDVNNPDAMRYDGATATPVESVSPEEFQEIYQDFGYGEAIYQDPNSLSYIAAPSENLWILGIDSCEYDQNTTSPETSGSLSDETKAWILEKLAEAKLKGITVIGMMHHNLAEHYTLQADLFPEYVITDDTSDGTSLAQELADAGLSMIFTGHYHANDINNVTDSGMYEVETGSLVTWPSPVRTLTIDGNGTVEVTSTSVTEIDYDLGGAASFEEYATDYLVSGLEQLAVYYLVSAFGVTPAAAAQVAPLFAAAMAAHYMGDEQPDAVTLGTIQAMAVSGDPMQVMLAGALQSLWTDSPTADNNATLSFPDFWADKTVEDLREILADDYGLTPQQHYELYGEAMAINPNYPVLNASVDGLGNVVTIYFEEVLDTTSIPDLSQFTVLNGDEAQTITALQVVNNQVILTCASPLDTSEEVSVSYTGVADTLQSADGQDVLSLENIEITNYLSLTGSESESFAFATTIAMDYGAEISAFDAASGRIFVTSPQNGLQVLGIDDQLQLTKLGTIDLGSNDVNSVAVKDGIVAVAVAAENKTDAGTVWFLDADGTIGDPAMILGSVTVGALPDMLTFSADGKTVLVANEGEMAEDGTNPEGSVSIIDLSNGVAGATVRTASFADFNDRIDELKAAGVRLFAGESGFESTTVAQDLEPEYISISPDGSTAFVTLQENNAIAILDIETGTFSDIVPLGQKSFLGLPFDGSDKDGGYLPGTDLPVYGQYMPDAIASFTGVDGETYYVIANEGDDRDDFIKPDETAKVSKLNLDDTEFPDEAELKTDAEIGVLKVSNASGNNGDTDGDGDIDQLLSYGARSFSIINSEGVLVFDSGSHMEQFAAANDILDDGRSDAKGVEPEGITIGVVGDRTLAFVTLERGEGGVMVYDVTNPAEVSFVQYLGNSGDISPEGVLFVSADDSPSGRELLIVSNETSNSVTLYQENDAPTVGEEIEDVVMSEDSKLEYVVMSDSFADADAGDSLTYTATLADGSPLPEWLQFDASHHDLDTMEQYFLPGGNPDNATGVGAATDSASAGTAIATGVKTVDGNVAWERDDNASGEIETIAETLRDDLGYAIGVASTVPFSHATPATFVSHDVSRNNYWDIAHEILFETQPDVVIGGGLENSNFAKATTNAAKLDADVDNNGYNDDYDAFINGTDGTDYVYVDRESGVDGGDALKAAAAEVDLSAGEKLFGLFGTSGGNFEYYEVADTPGTATITRSTGDSTPTVDEDPTLAEVTNASLSVLNQDEDGFFIMIEQGDIDWTNHANDYENMVGGVYDLEEAVKAAETFVESGSNGISWENTLIIVTSDHSNSYLRSQEELGIGDLPTQNGKSYPDGEVTYGTGGHTNELVSIYARGAGSELFEEAAGDIYAGTEIIDNTQIYDVMMQAAKEAGAEHVILFIGDGMNIEHEIAGSRYLYGEDYGLAWQDWSEEEDGWSGYVSTWDVTAYNSYAKAAGVAAYSEATFDPLIGYDPSQGGETPYPVAMTFSGTPDNGDVGTLDIVVTATDESGASVSQTFSITVDNANDAPTVEETIGDVTVKEDATLEYTIPADAFADSDAGDSLTYGAKLANGSALPEWLQFSTSEESMTFSGTPDNGDVGTLDIVVTATDESGASVSQTFSIIVDNVNDAPTVGEEIEDVVVSEDTKLEYVVMSDSFADADAGDSLTYTATLADGSPLPEWLQFDASHHDLDTMEQYFLPGGNPDNATGVGAATDSASAGTAIATGVKTVDGNVAWERDDNASGEIETIAETLRDDLGYAIGVASTVPFSHATPATFVSHDVSRNNYWDIAHEILFETQPDVVIGGGLENSNFAKATTNAAKLDADVDNNGYNDDYDAFVNGTDGTDYVYVDRESGVDGGDALKAAAAEVDLSAGEKLFGLFGTSGGNFEYYEVADTPGTATITRSTGDSTPTVDEDPTLAEVTNASLSVLNQDEDGFFIMIEQGDIDWSNHANDYENMVGGVYDLEEAVKAAETFVESGSNGISWENTLIIVTSDHSNSYLRSQEELGIGDLPAQNGKSYPDGEVTYGTGGHTNELVSIYARGAGSELFEEAAGDIYAGTEIIDNTQIYDVMMQAAKEAGAEHVILFIGDGMNIEHEIAGSRYLYGEDYGLAWQDWSEEEDGWSGYVSTWDVTAYNSYAKAAGVAAYSEATFDPLIGYNPETGGETPYPVAMTFSGTPDNGDVGTLDIVVTATDESGASVSQTFSITVDNANDAPTVENPVQDMVLAAGEKLEYAVAATFADEDAGDSLTYTATLADGSSLPAWMQYSASKLSGTPTKADTGIYELLLTATDLAGLSVSDLFTLTVTSKDFGETTGNDNLSGSRTDDVIYGDAGNDSIAGNDGDDTLIGGVGNDTMQGGRGDDTYYVDSEGDVVRESSSSFGGFFSFFGNRSGGIDTVKSKVDWQLGTGIENLELLGSDDLDGTGNVLDNELVGNEGDNMLEGLFGNDSLIGNGGDDILDGGWGNDLLFGGEGADLLTGGSGRDIFRYTNASESGFTAETMDIISDFTSRQDRLDLSGMDANSSLSGDQSFSRVILGSSGTFTSAGQLRFDSAEGILYGNTDGDADAEFAIQLSGVNSLRATDVML